MNVWGWSATLTICLCEFTEGILPDHQFRVDAYRDCFNFTVGFCKILLGYFYASNWTW